MISKYVIFQNELSVSLIEESEEDFSFENFEDENNRVNGKKV